MARDKVFRFKQFSVQNDKSAMKVGTDGVLLGAWADVSDARQILDVGTGTGLIALMLAQRCDAKIDAVEIDRDAVSEADINFRNSPWKEQFTIIHDDFVNFAKNCSKKYDIIISNPPYFINSLECPDEKRRKARHANSLSFQDLVTNVLYILMESGSFFLITPSDVENLLTDIIKNENVYVIEKMYVCPTKNTPPKRIMWKISKTPSEYSEKYLTIEHERHVYTNEYIELTRDYYLNM